MKSRHCASVWLLIQHIHTGRQELELLHSDMARGIRLLAYFHVKMKQFQTGAVTSSGYNEDADMHIAKPSPKRCASMRIAHQTRTEVFNCHRAAADTELHKTRRSSSQRRINIHKPHLDGLRRLAFNLMRYGGGLVHLGTPTQTVLLSK